MLSTQSDRRVVVVTGSSRGIGLATARCFFADGWLVVLNGRDERRLKRTAATFDESDAVLPVTADVSQPSQAEALVAATLQRFGRLDALVNNAGSKFHSAIDQVAPGAVERVFSANVRGALYPTLAALPALRISHGSVVFVSSVAGLYGLPYASIYSASKMALAALAQSLSAELHGDRIHVGVLHVGFTENDPDAEIMDGSGQLHAIPDRNVARQTQERVALAVVRMVMRRRHRGVLSPAGLVLDVMSRHFPRIAARLLRSLAGRFSD